MQLTWQPTPAGLMAALRRAQRDALTYPEVGASAAELPLGYAHLLDSAHVAEGVQAWERIVDALLRWDLHREAGMMIATSTEAVETGCTVVNAAPIGPIALLAPCRVVDRFEGPSRRGFAYGTLPGHPLVGEERFTVELDQHERVHLHIRSFSRPVGLTRVSPPLARAGQHLINRRYAAAARRLAR